MEPQRSPSDEATHSTAGMTPRWLRELAGERYFDRGAAYFAEGAVRSLRLDGDGVEAVVEGTRRYRVRLWLKDGDLGHDCRCPLGDEGTFCKHCVAVGLAWHAGGQGDGAGAAEIAGPAFGTAALRDYLLGLEKAELVSLLLDQAAEDERLHRRLSLRGAQATPGSATLSVWKDALRDALAVDGYVGYREAYDYACGIDEVIDSLDDLLRQGQAESVIALADHGLDAIEQSLGQVDDSDGRMGGLLARLQALHLEACRRARPDPVALAARLFEREMESPYETFHGAAGRYADVLGEAGLAAYRRLAEAEWATVPALGPGDVDPNRYGRRFHITSAMEAVARASDDFEALIAVKSRDLSLPYAFLDIARLYEEAGDPERALDWAERGWRAFEGTRRDERLRAFLAEAYQGRGRHDEAMALTWDAFAEQPRLETYRQLEQHGRRAGQWPFWRDKALALARERIAGEAAAPPDRRTWADASPRDHSLLVEILLHEGDPQAAWREAEAGGCTQRLWLELAKRREQSHPQDAVRIYKAHVDALLHNTGGGVYEEAVGTLETIGRLLARCGEEAAFRAFLTEVRAAHRRKRNLMKLLDRKGW